MRRTVSESRSAVWVSTSARTRSTVRETTSSIDSTASRNTGNASPVAEHRPATGGLLERLEDYLARNLARRPRFVVELVELGEVVDDCRAGSTHDGDPTATVGVGSDVEPELDPSPQRLACRECEAHALRLVRCDHLRGTPFNDLDRVVTASERSAASSTQIVDDLALG